MKIIKPLWGWYKVISKKRTKGHKVKYLYIEPNKSLSNQKHSKRSEHWFILEGSLHLDLVVNGSRDGCGHGEGGFCRHTSRGLGITHKTARTNPA